MEVIKDPLLRQLLWTSFYDLTRDANMKSTDFLNLVSSKISIENDPKLLQTVISRALGALIHFVPNALVPNLADKLFHSFYAELNKAVEKDFQIVWARAVVDFARTEATVKNLEEQLRNNNPVFTQDLRWSIIQKLHAWSFPDAAEFLKKEQAKDNSDTGVRAVLKANTSIPDLQVKNAAWERFLNPETKMSAHQSAAEMSGFRWSHQDGLLAPFTDKFFQEVTTIFKKREKEFASTFFLSLFPSDPENPKILQLAKDLLSKLTPDDKHLSRVLKEEIDDLERELKCRNLVLHS
jgi:aminopeptidase N